MFLPRPLSSPLHGAGLWFAVPNCGTATRTGRGNRSGLAVPGLPRKEAVVAEVVDRLTRDVPDRRCA
ncbi:Uncharacterised protein [Rhodococcus gordoniae]|uniref:Uncharacterized protein n=1 Tax=Rhodococcus gordoniae TaxID=223392 RepID=A0A379LWA8_9NOCA|nr:Uncharacterised protein [Rhodococcus gordoniae]